MIDFHCHIDLFSEPLRLVAECERAGITVLSVTTTPSAWEGTRALAPNSKYIRTALGLHPELAHERHGELPLFDRLITGTAYVGEIGLDHSPGSDRNWAVQSKVLRHILQSCQNAGGRIMSLHSRRAAREVLDLLEQFPHAGTPVLHWMSSGVSDLNRAINLGCWFSVGPAMLASKKGRDLVAQMPKDRVLTESDGPFAIIGGRRATPFDASLSFPPLAELWGETQERVRRQLLDNLERLERGAEVAHGRNCNR